TADGSATAADHDYNATSGDLHFGANENSKTISVAINGDTKAEANETFGAHLSAAPNRATISRGHCTGTIVNDDAAPVAGAATINAVMISEANNVSHLATFTATRSARSLHVALPISTADGSATAADRDYNATSGDLHFGANENSKTISVAINGDTKAEA